MSSYNDLEIQCLVDAILRHGTRLGTQRQEKHDDLKDILRETAHVLELLMEPAAARSVRHIADDLEYVDEAEFTSLRADMQSLLEELNMTSFEEAMKCTWIQVPDHLSYTEAQEALDDLES